MPLYPVFQRYLRARQPPVLAIWGRNDGIFVPAGAEAFRGAVGGAEVHLVDGGHFPLENHLEEVAGRILEFLAKNGI